MAKEEKAPVVHQWSELPSFKVKIPDIEIEYHNTDSKDVEKKFAEIVEYLKEIMVKTQAEAKRK